VGRVPLSRLRAGLLAALSVVAGWSLVIAFGGKFTAPAGVDGRAQIAFLLAHPEVIPNIAVATLRAQGETTSRRRPGCSGEPA